MFCTLEMELLTNPMPIHDPNAMPTPEKAEKWSAGEHTVTVVDEFSQIRTSTSRISTSTQPEVIESAAYCNQKFLAHLYLNS